jgi:hypothetical protein
MQIHQTPTQLLRARVIIVSKNLAQIDLAWSAALGGKSCRAEQQFFAGKIEGVFSEMIITRAGFTPWL